MAALSRGVNSRMHQLDFHTHEGGLGWRGSERAGLRARGGWCHKLLSTAPPDVFRLDFHTVKAATVAVVDIAKA